MCQIIIETSFADGNRCLHAEKPPKKFFIHDLGAIWPTTPSSLVRAFCSLSEYVLAYAFTLIVDSHALFNRCVAIGRT